MEVSTPQSLLSDYEFSFLHGTKEIAGRAAYNPPDDYTIPSYVRAADPLPPSIQLYGCNVLESPMIFASPLIYWLGALMLFLLLSLFFLNREMRRNQSDLERALKELELRRSIEDSMNLALVITDLNNKIVYTNGQTEENYGILRRGTPRQDAALSFWGDGSELPSQLLKDRPHEEPGKPYRFDLTIRCRNDET